MTSFSVSSSGNKRYKQIGQKCGAVPLTPWVKNAFALGQGADASRGMHSALLFNYVHKINMLEVDTTVKVEIITLAPPQGTISIKSFCRSLFKIHNMLSLLMVSSPRRDVLKCADNQNNIWFIFFPHG